MEKKKKSIVIGVTGLLLVTLILLGLTYAYYRTRIVGNTNETSVSVTSKKTEVTYADGNATLSTTGTIEPGFTAEKEFTVKNTGSESVKFSIILDNIENTFTRDGDWTYVLKKGTTQIATGTIAVGTHQILVGSETLASGNATYKLEVTYANSTEDQSIDMGESLKFRVNISEETTTWDNATSGTLLYAIKNNAVLTVDGVAGSESTTPGREASTNAEARILETQDDYGTSYVYRGNVGNNYVTYSNMCWRIVRVQGDGTIKLALADENHPCGTENGYSPTDNDSAFIYNGDKYPFGTMYDMVIEGNYTSSGYDQDSGNLLRILNEWAISKELNTTHIVETDWCHSISGEILYNNYDGFSYTVKLFSASARLSDKNNANASLMCNETSIFRSANLRYKGNIALLTADELAFAGSTSEAGTSASSQSYSYYLKTNATKDIYWTMSPSYWHDAGVFGSIIVVRGDGSICNYSRNGDNGNCKSPADSELVRPSIVLASNVTIASSGNGTQSSPYVIN